VTEFNDGSQYRVLEDPAAYAAAGRDLFMYRVASQRADAMYVDTAFQQHRRAAAGLRGSCLYQYVYATPAPEQQAAFFCQAVGVLQAHEMVMLDIESGGGIADHADLMRRWCRVVEPYMQTLAWIYVPGALATVLPRSVTGARIVMAPRYGGPVPTWSHDVHQYTDVGPFPGCSLTGDTSRTALTTEEMLARCNPGGTASPCHT
jgi:hypothetical protein